MQYGNEIMMQLTAQQVITLLKLKPLEIEGGFFAETYRSREPVAAGTLPRRYQGKRAFATAIYYLLTSNSFSAIHRLHSDEIFHFYAGDPVEMFLLTPPAAQQLVLGTDLVKGQRPQIVVPRGVWQGARLVPGGKWALLGTTVAPGFDRRDFELGNRMILLEQYPRHRALISALTNER
jgi:uncharacterized protein